MRRARKKRSNSTEKKSSDPLTGSLQNHRISLDDRIRSLERRVDALEQGLGIAAVPEEGHQKKPGPHPKISDEDLFGNRNALVDWLEVCWPDVSPKLLSAREPQQIIAVLMPYAGPETSRSFLIKRLIDNAGVLLSFLWSRRFHRKPAKAAVVEALNKPWNDKRQMRAAAKLPTRQIANAMAGVPELEWRTSLDRCSKVPSHLVVGKRTADHYRELFGVPPPKERNPKEMCGNPATGF